MSIEPRTKRERRARDILLGPGVFWLVVFFLIPLLIILVYSFVDRGKFGGIVWTFQLDNYARFVDPLYIRIFWRSFLIAAVTTVICLVAGYPMAYWLATRAPRKRSAFLLLMIIPFWTNFVVRTYAWRAILAREGILNQALIRLGLVSPENPLALIFNDKAVIIGLIYVWVIAMVLPLYANLAGLDPSLLEAARDLYANNVRAFLAITVPLTIPGIVAGSILVFVPSFGAFVTPDMLGGGKADMIGNLIQQQFGEAQDWPFGSAISAILMIVMLLGTILYFRSLRSETRVS
jgi:spermidine/putrescine transport system permease protein